GRGSQELSEGRGAGALAASRHGVQVLLPRHRDGPGRLAEAGEGRESRSLERRSSAKLLGVSSPIRPEAARWRLVCVLSLAVFLGLGLAVYAAGVLPGDAFLRREVLATVTGLVTEL